MKQFQIEQRRQVLINNDPQRRCYNGCHFSTEIQVSGWEVLESGIPEDSIAKRLRFWRELNEYAVFQRGKSALVEYQSKAEPTTKED